MDQGNFDTFGQWLNNRMQIAQLTPHALASYLESTDIAHVKRLCDNQAKLQMRDWPILSKHLELRFDELLIVMEHYHPEWVKEYDLFISNCLRYLLWRVDQNKDESHGWLENLLSSTLEELIEPACTGRFDSIDDRRKIDRRGISTMPAHDKRGRPRRLTDLIHYLKNQIGFLAWTIGVLPGLLWMHTEGLL